MPTDEQLVRVHERIDSNDSRITILETRSEAINAALDRIEKGQTSLLNSVNEIKLDALTRADATLAKANNFAFRLVAIALGIPGAIVVALNIFSLLK